MTVRQPKPGRDGGMEFSWSLMQFERYRYPVTTYYYSDNFRFAEEKGE